MTKMRAAMSILAITRRRAGERWAVVDIKATRDEVDMAAKDRIRRLRMDPETKVSLLANMQIKPISAMRDMMEGLQTWDDMIETIRGDVLEATAGLVELPENEQPGIDGAVLDAVRQEG